MSAHKREVARLTSSLHTHWVTNSCMVHSLHTVIEIARTSICDARVSSPCLYIISGLLRNHLRCTEK